MTVFYMNLSIVYLCSFFSRYLATREPFDSHLIKPNKYFVFLTLTTLVLVSGLRNNIGDTYFYIHSYKTKELSWETIDFKGDFGFNIYQMFLQQMTNNPQVMIFTTALITNILIIITLYRYSRMFELAIYVYITLGCFLVSMNGIRQYLAASIIFAATKFIIDGNWKGYMSIVLVAATIHQTALILIPIYFVVRKPAWSKITFLLLLFSIVIVFGFNQFMDLLFTAIEDTQYGRYQNAQEEGANVLRVVVTAVPIFIAFLGRNKLKELFPNSDIFINMSILNLMFMLISTQNWIFARFSIYFGLYQLILISWIVKIFIEKDQKLAYYGILVCYFIYFVFEQHLSLNMQYRSDYFTF